MLKVSNQFWGIHEEDFETVQLTDLNYDTQLEVFKFLSIKDLVQMSRVSRKFSNASIHTILKSKIVSIRSTFKMSDQIASEIQNIYFGRCMYLSSSANISNLRSLVKLTNLRHLDLNFRSKVANKVGVIMKFTRLRKLNIRCNHLSSEDIKKISTLTELRMLDISHNDAGFEGTKELAGLTNLHTLGISNNNVGSKEAEFISKLPKLHTLKIAMNELGPEGAGFIATLTRLRELDICDNNLGPEGVSKLTELTCLHTLGISDNDVGPRDIRKCHFPNVRVLVVGNYGCCCSDWSTAYEKNSDYRVLYTHRRFFVHENEKEFIKLTGFHVMYRWW